jgi:hypothetical protein
MTRSILMAAVLLAAAASGAPASAQQSTVPSQPATAAASEAPITFAEYRRFRLAMIARREARLAERLAEPGLSSDTTARLARQKAYYDRLIGLSDGERDRIFRARFARIDSDHNGMIDAQERAAWRTRQREYYRQLARARAREGLPPQP